jgi:ribosomal protein L37AE/L43A
MGNVSKKTIEKFINRKLKCPECGSKAIDAYVTFESGVIYECRKCSYEFYESEKIEQEILENLTDGFTYMCNWEDAQPSELF